MTTSLLDNVLTPVADCLTLDAARRIADLRADPETQARVDELADKANEGMLTADESAEYDRFLAVYHVVSILQARARAMLRESVES